MTALKSLSRRNVLIGAACLLCAGRGAHAGAQQLVPTCEPIAAPPVVALDAPTQERHSIILLLAMALAFDGWGVDRSRPDQVAAYAAVEPVRSFPDYAGHNIAAVLVDRNGAILACALNRNVALNSTLAHAEARTVDGAIHLANAKGAARWSFGSLLKDAQLYTTLEPCAQCAGIMDLANLGSVIYGQDDPAQHHVSSVLYNLHAAPGAPAGVVPIRATFMSFWDALDAAYERFVAAQGAGERSGLTSFLQTVDAFLIYRQAATLFDGFDVRHPQNARCLQTACDFRARWSAVVRDQGFAPVT